MEMLRKEKVEEMALKEPHGRLVWDSTNGPYSQKMAELILEKKYDIETILAYPRYANSLMDANMNDREWHIVEHVLIKMHKLGIRRCDQILMTDLIKVFVPEMNWRSFLLEYVNAPDGTVHFPSFCMSMVNSVLRVRANPDSLHGLEHMIFMVNVYSICDTTLLFSDLSDIIPSNQVGSGYDMASDLLRSGWYISPYNVKDVFEIKYNSPPEEPLNDWVTKAKEAGLINDYHHEVPPSQEWDALRREYYNAHPVKAPRDSHPHSSGAPTTFTTSTDGSGTFGLKWTADGTPTVG
jgi:hypothetical protein